jgi:virulence-associated protein VapD
MLVKYRLLLISISITLVLGAALQTLGVELEENHQTSFSYSESEKIVAEIGLLRKQAQVYVKQQNTEKEIETRLKISEAYTELGQHRLGLIELKKAKKSKNLDNQRTLEKIIS